MPVYRNPWVVSQANTLHDADDDDLRDILDDVLGDKLECDDVCDDVLGGVISDYLDYDNRCVTSQHTP